LVASRQETRFVCFAAGTRILTDCGEVPVERLKPGHRAMTLDRGTQLIRWVHQDVKPLGAEDTDANPVLISAGALGAGKLDEAVIVSLKHRV